jgi:type II secretory pathway pseudopilin PulG
MGLERTTQPNLNRNKGQTLVITLIVLFVLVTLGFVLILVLGRQIGSTGIARERNVANDLAQAGIRYTYAQLRFSEAGADWRPQPPLPVLAAPPGDPPGLGPESDPENQAATNPDPDFYWMRRRVDFTVANPLDKGGPDGLGCFSRLNYDSGRALIRVRYAPSGQELFDASNLNFTQRAKLHHYTIVEVAGRPGNFNSLDPTSSRAPNLQNARELSAIVPIGIIETAYYVSNKDERNQAIELGAPADFGTNFLGSPVRVKRQIGGDVVARPGGLTMTLGGSMYLNGDARFFGNITDPTGASGTEVYLNADLGDQIIAAGDITFAESATPTRVFRVTTAGTNQFDLLASAAGFSTFGGLVRDGREGQDPQGFPRFGMRKEPPLMDEEDPNTGQLRYRLATRSSGVIGVGGFNLGRLGYGSGTYIANNNDLNRDSEDGSYSQRNDWLTPGASNNWKGPYYIPPGARIVLDLDGFTITRHGTGNNETWRDYTGLDTGRRTLRFKLGFAANNDLRIINELTPGVTNFGTPSAADFSQGMPFNGLIFAEGNIRVRGVIPAVRDLQSNNRIGVQLTLVTLGSAYIEGSIVKGHTQTSTLAVLARDNVVLNTSMFFGPKDDPLRARDNNDPTTPERIRVSQQRYDMFLQLPNDPLTGTPYLSAYTYNNPNRTPGNAITASLYVAHAADYDRSAFFNLLINADTNANPEYLFENQDPPNAASPLMAPIIAPPNPIPTYGLANPGTQVLPIYEKRRFELFPIAAAVNGSYTFLTGGMENVFGFKTDNTISVSGAGDYFYGRMAVQPMDVRIEAALYAQEGSFFVLPGPWMNPNPNDRRDAFTTAANRFANFQASQEYPFYAEPVDVRITIMGSVSENFPPVMSDQAQWLQHWGWIPAEYGESGQYIPDQHFPRVPGTNNPDFATYKFFVPNLGINYDPTLISGRTLGSFDFTNANAIYVRTDRFGRPLPPMPKLPVGTKMFYFGEVNP